MRRWQIGLAFAAITLSFFIGLLWVNHVSQDASHRNHERIVDIQQSRIATCSLIAQSFHDVFAPFLPPPARRSAQQRHDIRLFNRGLAKLRHRCIQNVQQGSSGP